MRSGTRTARERGFALLIVLWVAGILSLLVAVLISESRGEAKLTTTLHEAAAARAAADGAIASVVIDVLRAGSATAGWLPFGPFRVAIRTEELSGRINPNVAPADMLQALLLRLGVEPRRAAALAASIVDWRTPGAIVRASEYRAVGLPYGPPGRPFESIEELRYVAGMTYEVLAAMKPHLTLWSQDPNPALADPVVLAALRDSGAPFSAGRPNVARVLGITATAISRDNVHIMRYAVVSFGYSPDGRGWRILEWDDGELAR